jgi:hypothetical protein
MRNIMLKALLALFVLQLSWQSLAVKTVGKTSSKVTATVIFHEWVDVSAPGGAWYDQPQELVQWGSVGSAYTLELPLVIEANVEDFLVSLDSPVELVNQTNGALRFKDISVTLGNEIHPFRELTATPEQFSNAAMPTPDDSFKDTYQLKISAKPPAGDVSSTVGSYLGTLALTFEPVAVAP